jgi:large subunit ribosomal protein L15e
MAKENKTETKQNKEKANKEPQKSAHGFYHYLKEAWKHPTQEQEAEQRQKLISWREGDRITKLEKPTRLDRARNLGYKAKKGFIVYRVVIERGGRHKARPTTKRRSKRFNIKKMLRMNYRWVAEQRVQRKHQNLEVLNSYLVGQDGKYFFFEVIMVDRNAPEIKADKNLNWITMPANKFRAYRGLTSAGRKSRGLFNRQRNLKVRPSLRSWNRQGR